ncbi:septal ring lytic transglycosylase RlpA family protein [Sphingomonas sp.]|uniref:septal ring lytic transglycosylase RlpA family protein n=1 Tax=Sphingomonas sp. TaxID=28214 RepID=UPI0025D42090|nr:septal ring lytic transglycosylase RlpA family protein [Sphingomonas sp.]
MRWGILFGLALASPALAQEPPPGAGPRGTSQDFGAQRYDAVGYASWYGDEMAGQPTASGQPFNPDAIIAAHPTLALGSFAEVTALDTGRTILVMIADRGPNMPGRLIDLSRGAARLLGNDRAGLLPVRVRAVEPPAADQTALRAGTPGSARLDSPPAVLVALRKKLGTPPVAAVSPPPPRPAAGRPAPVAPRPAAATGSLFVQVAAFSARARAEALAGSLGGTVTAANGLYRVRLGPFADRTTAERARADAAGRGYGDARLIQE